MTKNWSAFETQIISHPAPTRPSFKQGRVCGYLLVLLAILLPTLSFSQSGKTQTGMVSYVTSTRVYVKFDNTQTIQKGDTLYSFQDNKLVPAAVVGQKSSLSIVATSIAEQKLSKGDLLQFNGKNLKTKDTNVPEKKILVRKKDPIRGSISAGSNVQASSATDFDARNLARVRLRMNEINDSRFSLSTHLIYRQNLEASEDTIYQSPGLFNVYNLFLKYEKEDDYSIGVGRKINRRVASLGMIDGVHLEKQLGSFHVGGIAGFRSNFQNNGFNTNMPQMGGYLGVSHQGKENSFDFTVGLLEQKNGNAIDRRYVYVQGTASLGYGFSLFSSAEMDLYTLNSDLTQGGNRLTNFHISANYRLNKMVRFSANYDTRKQIIFYETFQTNLERLIADDEARQGIRARVTIRPFKRVTLGAAYGKRYQNNMANASDNYNLFGSIRNMPVIGGVISANLNVNQSNYLNSVSTTLRHSRYYFRTKVSASTYLRSVAYSHNPERDVTILQQFAGTQFNYFFGDKFSLGGLIEFSLRQSEYKNRFNIQLTKRF
ncbi:MAG: hypothetical protein R8G66_11160 [Cytophagales bacterium]|nr:hypothetical protein [Cytophagales bacterium]